jgi:hypothetical protein
MQIIFDYVVGFGLVLEGRSASHQPKTNHQGLRGHGSLTHELDAGIRSPTTLPDA